MQIYGPSHVHALGSIQAPHARGVQSAAGSHGAQPQDEVTLSDSAQLLSRLAELPDVRGDRIAQLRAEIAGGNYETSHKLDVALDRLLDELA